MKAQAIWDSPQASGAIIFTLKIVNLIPSQPYIFKPIFGALTIFVAVSTKFVNPSG